MTPDEQTNLISGLREFADFLEAHPDLPMGRARQLDVWFGYVPTGQTHEPAMRQWATAFRTFEKKTDEFLFMLKRAFGGLTVTVRADRDKVCRKMTLVKEVTEWVCPESLLSVDAVEPEPAEEAVAG